MQGWQPAVLSGCPPVDAQFLVHYRQRFLTPSSAVLLSAQALALLGIATDQALGLGHYHQKPVYLCQSPAADVTGNHWSSLRQLLVELDDPATVQMLRYASQIGTWHERHRFCGACGQPMQRHPSERAMCCSACDLRAYAQLSPCMIALVTDGDRLLLARSPHHAPGMYSTLAGFVEPGESVEACVVREVREEVGVEISRLRYVASQNWPFPHALMLGFCAQYAGGEIVPQVNEIEDARWFPLDRLPILPSQASIARYLIDSYCAERLGRPAPALPV